MGWVQRSLAVVCLLALAAACSGDDDDGSSTPCDEGCAKAASLCDLDSSGRSQCVSECTAAYNAADAEAQAAAEQCIAAASSCAEATACIP